MTSTEIQTSVEKALPGSTVNVQDYTGGGDHFQVVIISPEFEGKGLVEQHKMVYAALGEALGSEQIHALALKTYTPEQWSRLGT